MPRPSPDSSLVVVFGDQLHLGSAALARIDKSRDTILMMEVEHEAKHVPSHRQRTTLFLSAMRHFRDELLAGGFIVRYVELDDPRNTQTIDGEIRRAIEAVHPCRVVAVRPGEWRVLSLLEETAAAMSVELELLEDTHFLQTPQEFSAWADGRRTLVQEFHYRHLRSKLGILVGEDGKPEDGTWNHDKENRKAFGREGPSAPAPLRFPPDAITRDVMALVGRRFPEAPGAIESFAWPVTRADGLRALDDFIRHRLPLFGPHQDAMWTGEPWLFHSLLSPAMNLKLLDPRRAVDAAVAAYRGRRLPLSSVEGFVRQIVGWREFIRGVYWHEGPEYAKRNALGASANLPEMYWSADTDMRCMRECLGQVLEHGFGHHIQRLMVTGNFALLAGIDPRKVSDWYLGMYVDAVDWVTLPNTLGMSQHADGGVVGTKAYVASGKYIDRMSNYCSGCAYDPDQRIGPRACPFTTLYWDFIARHADRFERNPRMAQQVRAARRLDDLPAVRRRATDVIARLESGDL